MRVEPSRRGRNNQDCSWDPPSPKLRSFTLPPSGSRDFCCRAAMSRYHYTSKVFSADAPKARAATNVTLKSRLRSTPGRPDKPAPEWVCSARPEDATVVCARDVQAVPTTSVENEVQVPPIRNWHHEKKYHLLSLKIKEKVGPKSPLIS